MRVKMGTVVPKMGTFVHLVEEPTDYRKAMALALHVELGETHRAIKMAMRWTGASERTVKYWFAGERGPRGDHLIALVQHSDAVLYVVLALAGRLIVDEANGRDAEGDRQP
ncbi:MAG: XRE family transcriptional regulator [Sediminimonas qiaohouensis]|uniref:XRE family transcriptional regulator n=1 Tax=Sediminimonas qiaohouensis TaxID=552061 RepID=A0A7C9LTG0_9RHOB|nr:XRE family transcriptional regulator [Sediminimonas qiaohouensis]MTJ05876.1 XRE family transcriptional regulator [Sediminimonas qiaohouensis]